MKSKPNATGVHGEWNTKNVESQQKVCFRERLIGMCRPKWQPVPMKRFKVNSAKVPKKEKIQARDGHNKTWKTENS